MRYSTFAGALGALALLTLTACGKDGQAGTPGGAAKNGGGTTSGTGQGGPGGGGPGGPGGRGPSAMVLGPSDVTDARTVTIEASILINGDLKPIEEIAVRSRVEGNVQQVYVREGDRVGAGQLLARFENAVQEGDRASAAADVESAKADVANAQWNADQSDELYKAGAIPERDLRTAQQALAASKARLAAAEARLKASLQNANDTRILSPTTGVVSTRTVEAGEHVTRGATIFTVVRNDVLELEASVPARQANELKVSQPVRFAAAGRQLQGKVARIAPTINPQNRSITVYIQVPNRDGAIKGNSFATGRIIGQSIPNALAIPTPAVRQSARDNKPFVYRIEGGKVEHVEVELGVVDETQNMTQVLSGLAAGDQIIVGNVGALGRGMQVRVMGPNEGRNGQGGAGAPAAAGSEGKAPAGRAAARGDSGKGR
ncbi:MAG: efflux RND transporter periplasmic adaptor subunit [Gemmatimonadaceae bacterium]|nr:efflux RND transporter periplasmic adaptor subunit [Gemmatimonadaceae bacterium]